MTVTLLNLTVGCSYYKVKPVTTTPETIGNQIDDFNKTGRYAIIHSGNESLHLNNVIVNIDGQTIKGTIEPISLLHQYKKPRKKGGNRYSRSKQQPLDEIHFSLKSSITYEMSQEVIIPFSNISSISLNKADGGTSIAYVFLGTIGVIGFLAVIVALTKSSCPFVYIKNGEEYTFIGDLYPGVITSNLERNDYLHLPNFTPDNDNYVLKITNELREIQHTDMIELIVVNHEKDSKVLLDKKGIPHIFSNIISPSKVVLDNNLNQLEPAVEKDGIHYKFDTNIESSEYTRHIVLEFDNPTNAKQGKIYLTAKNSMWLDYVYGKFNEQFGNYFNTFQKDMQEDPAEKSLAWASNQSIPLSVYIQTANGWELVEEINVVGPLAQRDIVIPVNLERLNSSKVNIKLETGFMFWEVDYVGIDYTKDSPLEISYLKVTSAIDENGRNVAKLLNEVDQNYLTQSEFGNEVVVTFKSGLINPELDQSLFLKNRGYYNYIRDYHGTPDFDLLKSFEADGSFTKFSVEKYWELINGEQELLDHSIK